ncbi:MAG: MarR family transcriptional regulator, partial [Mycobacterium sp.]
TREGRDDDRRGANVDLTAGGRAALATAAPGHAELVRTTVFDGMAADELRALASLTERVLGRLG